MSGQSTRHNFVDRLIGQLAKLFAVMGGIGLFLLMAITVVSVFWRYALRDPIFGIEDLSVLTLAVVAAAGVAYGAVHGAHISVHLIASIFGRKVTRVTDLLVRLAGVGICGFATWGLVKKGGCGLPCGAITQNLNIPHNLFYYTLALAMGLYALLLISQTVVGLLNWTGTDPNEVSE